MSPRNQFRFAISTLLVGAFVVYFGTSLPASIPDCHSNRGKDAIEELVERATSPTADVGRIRETGRTFDDGGEIESYTCKVALQSDESLRIMSVQLKEHEGAVVAQQIGAISR